MELGFGRIERISETLVLHKVYGIGLKHNKLLSSSDEGREWVDHCNDYLKSLGKEVPNEFNFLITPLEFSKKWYVEERGVLFNTPVYEKNDLWKLKNLPNGMISGKFIPELFGVPWIPLDDEKIGMMARGGVIYPDNERGTYTMQDSTCSIYLSIPVNHSLMGDMPPNSLSKDGRNYHLSNGSFPRTHFIEYTFAKHCPGEEKTLSPGIRVELNPHSGKKTTFEREKDWSNERKRDRKQKSARFF